MLSVRAVLTSLLTILVLVSSAFTMDAVGINASDDAYIRMNEPNVNYGASELLFVRNRCGQSPDDDDFGYDALVQFFLSEIQYGCDVTSATLHIYYYEHGNTDPAGQCPYHGTDMER